MGEIKFEKKTLVEAINTTLQRGQGAWGNYRFLPSFWKFLGYSPAGWVNGWMPSPNAPR